MRTRTAVSVGLLIGVALAGAQASPLRVAAESADHFLSSLGVNTHVDQGYDANSYVEPLRYLGVRNIRDGQRNLTGHLLLHAKAGVRVDLLGADVAGLTETARRLARSGALLAIEGPNEPNNFPIIYDGRNGGGHPASWLPGWIPSRVAAWLPSKATWLPVAELQRDLYRAVKDDPELKGYPVFHASEGGAETDNVGLQFLTIPAGSDALLPQGTPFADFANTHNYVSGIRSGYVDNQAWQAADPVLDGNWDGLYGEYGTTWFKAFKGYSVSQLESLPRVTTETGWEAGDPEQERRQGVVLVNTYLAQFKRGWRYTFIYELGEGEGGGGNFGLFHSDWSPKLAARYIHNLTSILADHDNAEGAVPRTLDYALANSPATVHDLLLEKSNGVLELAIWGEQVSGSSEITIVLGNLQKSVKIYDTTMGDEPIQSLTDATVVPLIVSDHALILEFE